MSSTQPVNLQGLNDVMMLMEKYESVVSLSCQPRSGGLECQLDIDQSKSFIQRLVGALDEEVYATKVTIDGIDVTESVKDTYLEFENATAVYKEETLEVSTQE